MTTRHVVVQQSIPGAVVSMTAALLQEIVPEVPLLLSLLIAATLVALHAQSKPQAQ